MADTVLLGSAMTITDDGDFNRAIGEVDEKVALLGDTMEGIDERAKWYMQGVSGMAA